MSAAETVKGWSSPALFTALVGVVLMRELREDERPIAEQPNERVAVLETRIDSLAKREDITALGGKIDAYAKSVDGIERRVGSVENQVAGILAAMKELGERMMRVEKQP